MVPLLLHLLNDDLQTLLLSHWLDVRSLAMLDVAVSSHEFRPYWTAMLHSLRAASIDNMVHNSSSLKWLSIRGIHATRVQMMADAWLVPGYDLSLLQAT